MALKLNSSLSLLISTLSPNLSSNSSSFSPFLFSPTHFQSKTKIIPFLQNNCPMKSAALSTHAAEVDIGDDLPFDYNDIFPKADLSERRRAGVMLHPTLFCGPHDIGDLREKAFRFIDWLHEVGCSLWQVLPLVPPGRNANVEGSPYSGQDVNCGKTLLISVEELVKDGLLTKEELPKPVDSERVNYSTVADIKDPLITKVNNIATTRVYAIPIHDFHFRLPNEQFFMSDGETEVGIVVRRKQPG
ncbi:hypothetical protein ACFX1Q_000186 [Malus domestica]